MQLAIAAEDWQMPWQQVFSIAALYNMLNIQLLTVKTAPSTTNLQKSLAQPEGHAENAYYTIYRP